MTPSSATPKATVAVPKSGTLPAIPDHELIRQIGSGGSGQVWLAKNALGAYRAVKIIFERNFQSPRPFNGELDGVMKFEPISRQHDGLVDILHVGGGSKVGHFYFIMELADDAHTGQNIDPEKYRPRTLAQDLAERQRLPIGECIRLGATIASALGYLHRHGLIHRDVSPANIIFINGFPKLADTGLVAEIYEPSSYVGTEGFIAPEGPGTARADIYSLGKVLYEISTGKDRNDYPELPAHLQDNAEGRDLIQFNKIVLKACRLNPRLRYKSADDLLTALLTFQFSQYNPRKEQIVQTSTKVVGIIGLLIAIGVVTFMIFRIIWLLRHSS